MPFTSNGIGESLAVRGARSQSFRLSSWPRKLLLGTPGPDSLLLQAMHVVDHVVQFPVVPVRERIDRPARCPDLPFVVGSGTIPGEGFAFWWRTYGDVLPSPDWFRAGRPAQEIH